jgi:hypothetical protein
MPLTLKIAIVLLCFALCGAGTFVREESKQPQKLNTIPVKNHEIARRIWIQAYFTACFSQAATDCARDGRPAILES